MIVGKIHITDLYDYFPSYVQRSYDLHIIVDFEEA